MEVISKLGLAIFKMALESTLEITFKEPVILSSGLGGIGRAAAA